MCEVALFVTKGNGSYSHQIEIHVRLPKWMKTSPFADGLTLKVT